MDPFSLVVGSTALLTTILTVVEKSASLLQKIKNAPQDVQALSEETNHLKTVLQDIIVSSNTEFERIDPVQSQHVGSESQFPISNALTEGACTDVVAIEPTNRDNTNNPVERCIQAAQAAVRRLEELLAEILVETSDGVVKVDRLRWLTKQKQTNDLRAELSSLKVDFAVLFTSKTYRQLATVGNHLQDLSLRSMRRQEAIARLLMHVLRGQSDLCLQVEQIRHHHDANMPPSEELHAVERPLAIDASPSVFERAHAGIQRTLPVEQTSPAQDVSDGLIVKTCPEARICASKHYNFQPETWPLVSERTRIVCKPISLTHLFGRVVVGVQVRTARSPLERRNADKSGRNRSIIVSYYFPSWLIARQIIMTYNRKPLGTPWPRFHVRRLLPADSPLLQFVEKDDVVGLKRIFIQQQATPDDIEPLSFSGLTCAINLNRLTALKFLLKWNAAVLLEDSFGHSALDFAWISKLERRLAPDVLHFLENSTSFFLKSEDDPGFDALDKYEFTSIHHVVFGLPTELDLEAGVNTAPRALLDQVDTLGKTPLLWASRRGDFETVRLLLSRRADPNIADNVHRTPLHMACRARSVPVIKELLHHGAKATTGNFLNELPAHYACYEEGCEEMLDLLIKAGTDVNAPSKFGKTMLDILVQKDYATAVELLLDNGASPDGSRGNIAVSSWNGRPVGKAITHNALNALRVLVGKADLTFIDSTGWSVLHMLAESATLSCLEGTATYPIPWHLSSHLDKNGRTAQDTVRDRDLSDEAFRIKFEQLINDSDNSIDQDCYYDAVVSQV